MQIQQIDKFLTNLNQLHLAKGLNDLSLDAQYAFLHELETYGPTTLAWQRALLAPPKKTFEEYTPLTSVAQWGSSLDKMNGNRLCAKGKVGCILLAGGQGTRFGCQGPKGTIVVTQKKSLFQLFAEKVLLARQKAKASLPVAIMTSPLNDCATRTFFEKHEHFHLENLYFFSQKALPLLDLQGNWNLRAPGKLCVGPDGNGGAFEHFFSQGIWHQWQEQGITHVNICVIDNPLADPFDPYLIGFAARQNLDYALKGVERISLEEKMGVFAIYHGQLKVLEYFEFATPRSFSYAHTGLFCAKMSWIESLYAKEQPKMPYHLARKNVQTWQGMISAFQCERFLFDLLDTKPRAQVMLYPRERTYAPLKTIGDLLTVQQRILE